jgi:hypothetical protein
MYAQISPVTSLATLNYTAYINNVATPRWTVLASSGHPVVQIAVADFDNEQDAKDYVDNDPDSLLP